MNTTPEDVARDIMQHAVVADEEAWIAYAAEVIALDRAEAKAEALAGFEREDVAPFHGHGFTEPGYWRLVGPKHHKPLPPPPTDAEVKALLEHLGITEPGS